MGCWDYRIFCDDTSLDALEELVSSEKPLEDLAHFLDEAIAHENDFLDYDECQYALTAAAIIDAIINGVDWTLLTPDGKFDEDDDYVGLLKSLKGTDVTALRERAIKVIELATKEESELRELWEENTELYPKWIENLDTIKQRLVARSTI